MVEPWVSDAVTGLGGLVAGAIVGTELRLGWRFDIPRKPDESEFEWSLRAVRAYDQRLSFTPQLLLILVVVSVALSPVDVSWPFVVAGLIVGAALFAGIVRLAMGGVLRLPENAGARIRGRLPASALIGSLTTIGFGIYFLATGETRLGVTFIVLGIPSSWLSGFQLRYGHLPRSERPPA